MDNTELAKQLFLQALDHQSAGRIDLAEQALRQAHALLPERVSILMNLGGLLIAQKRHAEAAPLCEAAVGLAPDNPLVWLNHGICQRVMGNLKAARQALGRGHLLAPEHPAIRLELGILALDEGDPEAAREHAEYVIRLIPDSAEAHHLCGNALSATGRGGEAIRHFSRALELDPESSTSVFNRGLAYLMEGDYRNGFKDYEARWKAWKEVHGYESLPQWNAEIDPRGKKIIVHAEQGYGDSFMFCRFIPLLCDLGARVTVGVPLELLELFRSLRGVGQVVSKRVDAGTFDYQCPLASLPHAFRVRQDTLPRAIRYLDATPPPPFPARNEKAPRIGLVWAGSTPNDQRSIPFDRLEALLQTGHQFVCLQKEIPDPVRKKLSRHANVQCMTEKLTDFSATAAVMATLDAVVSVDSGVAHLAGALALPGWIMLPHFADWRWAEDQGCSLWYPSLHMIRQPCPGDWDSVITEVCHQLDVRFSQT